MLGIAEIMHVDPRYVEPILAALGQCQPRSECHAVMLSDRSRRPPVRRGHKAPRSLRPAFQSRRIGLSRSPAISSSRSAAESLVRSAWVRLCPPNSMPSFASVRTVAQSISGRGGSLPPGHPSVWPSRRVGTNIKAEKPCRCRIGAATCAKSSNASSKVMRTPSSASPFLPSCQSMNSSQAHASATEVGENLHLLGENRRRDAGRPGGFRDRMIGEDQHVPPQSSTTWVSNTRRWACHFSRSNEPSALRLSTAPSAIASA